MSHEGKMFRGKRDLEAGKSNADVDYYQAQQKASKPKSDKPKPILKSKKVK